MLKDYENYFKEVLGNKYDKVIARLNAGENFYYFDKGKVDKLIICVQEEETIIDYFENLFKEKKTFHADALDSDKDSLPDYLEEEFKSDKHNRDIDGDGSTDYEEYCYHFKDFYLFLCFKEVNSGFSSYF